MTIDELWSLWRRADGKCEVTGIPFSLVRTGGRSVTARPWIPSVDRISCAVGYEQNNCRIVCHAVNMAMNQWGEKFLMRIAKALYGRNVVDE